MSKIDINQRIPLSILEVALKDFLEDKYNPDYLCEQLAYEFKGENRIKKALQHITKIITKNPLLEDILNNKKEVLNALKNKGDKSVILIAMVNATFPFAFDTLNLFAKYFQVQEFVSWDLVQKEIKNKYGSNRSTENALYSVIPMLLEAQFFLRAKPGLYQTKEKITCQSKIARELYCQSFIMNNPLFNGSEMMVYEPYFNIVSISMYLGI
jgi:hypothetical protein